MLRSLSRSGKLISDMHLAALTALSKVSNGQMRHADLMTEIEQTVPLDEWAKQRYETSGNVRWRSIFAFASVGLVKAGYVRKAKSI